MTITVSDFNKIDHKVITLMGMSGVGKTHLSMLMTESGKEWFHYSCDLEIGTKYMGEEIATTLGEPNQIVAEDLSQLSRYVGRLGNPEEGGMAYDEFKRRQIAYYHAECESLRQLKNVVKDAVAEGYQNVINDSTGSLCEIDDDVLLDTVDENSLIVYIQANEEEEKEVLKRAQEYPKPMFFSPEKLDEWVAEFLKEKGLAFSEEMDQDEFSRWVFPKLLKNRLPKYQAIADKYGVTIPSSAFRAVKNSDDFTKVIIAHLPESY